jgi:hypothetical protein
MPSMWTREDASARREASARGSIEELQEVVRGELDLLVTPLGGAELAGDQPIRCSRRKSP